MNYLDNIILGDNQFFGVNHLSYEKGIIKEMHFQDVENVIQVMEWALELGAGGVMLSTHPRVDSICEAMKKNPKLRNNMNIYANIPYIVKYVREVNEKGIIGLLFDILVRISLGNKMKMLLRGGKNLIRKDLFDVFRTLIDLEMAYFSGLKVKAIFLHNVLVDVALGLDTQEVFEFLTEYIMKKYNVLLGFGTLNLPKLMVKLNRCGITNPLISASFNKKGLYMNPSRKSYEECVSKYDFQLLANGVLASGALKPKEAFDYLFSYKQDISVVIGASSRNHLEETIGLLKSYYDSGNKT